MKIRKQLRAAIREGDRHSAVLKGALRDWQACRARSMSELEHDPVRTRVVDQIQFRFMKLQDTVAQQLIPATLAALDQSYEGQPIRVGLNRLQRLGYLDVKQWSRWREARNVQRGDHLDTATVRFAALKATIADSSALVERYSAWRQKLIDGGLLSSWRVTSRRTGDFWLYRCASLFRRGRVVSPKSAG